MFTFVNLFVFRVDRFYIYTLVHAMFVHLMDIILPNLYVCIIFNIFMFPYIVVTAGTFDTKKLIKIWRYFSSKRNHRYRQLQLTFIYFYLCIA